MTEPMTDERLRQLRILVADDISDFANEAVASLLARHDETQRRLDAAEAAPCDHDSTAFEALERLHARVHRDFNFDANESAAPDDERWVRVMDDLVTFADEVYLPLADATRGNTTDTTQEGQQ